MLSVGEALSNEGVCRHYPSSPQKAGHVKAKLQASESDETLVEVIASALSLRSEGDGIARRLAPVALAAAIGVTVFLKIPICSIAFGLALCGVIARLTVYQVRVLRAESLMDDAIRTLRYRGGGGMLMDRALVPLDGTGLLPQFRKASLMVGAATVGAWGWFVALVLLGAQAIDVLWAVGVVLMVLLIGGVVWLLVLLLRASRIRDKS